MNNKVLFLIIGNEVKYLQNSTMDHKEWYVSLGFDPNTFDSVVRGFILDNKIIYFKGMYTYDEEVIKASKMFTPSIRYTMQNPSLEVYCGITFFPNSTNWEPVLKINENEITGFPVQKEEIPKVENSGPVVEFKNDYNDKQTRKNAIIVTSVVLLLTIIVKVFLLKQGITLSMKNPIDVLLVFGQVGSLIFSIVSYILKKEYVKYVGVVCSVLLILTLNIWDILLGIFYFFFSVDQNSILNLLKIFQKIKK